MQVNVDDVVAALSMALLIGSVLVWAAIVRRLAARRPPLEFDGRYGMPWSGLDVVVLALAVLFFEMAAAALVRAAAGGSFAGPSSFGLAIQSLGRVAWLAFALAYLLGKCGAYLDDLGWDAGRLAGDARLGGLTFLAALVPVFGVQWFFVFVLDMPSEHPLLKLMLERSSVPVMALATVLAVVVAPVFEEFLFRVLLQGWLESQQVRWRERRGDIDARPGFAPIVVTSLVFATLHAGHGPDPFALFVFSLFLGYVYRQTHRIAPSVVVHACLNGWTMLNLWLLLYAGQA
jgi:membrane protease YdiL (CAAX protease family)